MCMLFDEEYYESLLEIQLESEKEAAQKLVSNPVRAHFQTVAKLPQKTTPAKEK